LNVSFFRDLLQLRVSTFEVFFLGLELVEAGYLQQHAQVRTGNASQAQRANRRPYYQHIEVVDGDVDFAQLTILTARDKKYVKAFLQIAPR